VSNLKFSHSAPNFQGSGGKKGAENTGAAAVNGAAPDPFQGISSNRLEPAFQYIQRGLAIFPCKPCSKEPETPHGFLDASTAFKPYDHPRLKDFAQFFTPDGTEIRVNAIWNWAIEPGRAGFTVIDIDPKNGGDKTWARLVARYGPVTTRAARTPKGGLHLWFHGTLLKVNRKLGPGIDTRSFGGYVLLPPSRAIVEINGTRHLGSYTWVNDTIPIAPLPQWIEEEIEVAAAKQAEILTEQRARVRPTNETVFQNWQAGGNAGSRFDFFLSLIGDHEGGLGFYDPMLRAAGAGVALGMAADAILERLRETAGNADRCNHSPAEIQDRLAKMPGAIRNFRVNDAARRNAEHAKLDVVEESSPPEPEDEPQGTEEEEVAEAQGPFLWKPAAARTEVSEQVWQFINDPQRQKLLLRVTPGIGKTGHAIKALVRCVGKTQAVWDEDAEPDVEALLELDLRVPSKIVYAVPTHKLAQQVAKDLREELLKAGFEPENIDRMITVLEGRDRTCLRPEGPRALINKGRSAMQVCEVKIDGVIVQCPFLKSGECRYIPLKRKAPRSTFVIMTHAQLALEAAQAEKSANNINDYYFDLKDVDLIVIDEDVTSNLFDERSLVLNPGFFQFVLPLGRRRPRKLVEKLARLGALIDQSLAAHEGVHPFLRAADVEPKALREAAEIRRKVERRQPRIVTPSMPDAKVVEIAGKKQAFVRASIILDRLAAEMEAGCIHSGSLRLNAAGKVEARGLKPIRELLSRKLLILDGTANHAELSKIIPGLDEVRMDVERNAYFIKVRDHVFSKSACLKKVEGKDGKTRYEPTPLLSRAYRFIDFFVGHGQKTLIVTTRAMRCAMTGEDLKGKLDPYTEFRGAWITHYGNLTGLNDYAACQVEIQIGRELMPAVATEPDAAAIHHADPEPIKRITPDAKGHKQYSSRTSRQLMRDGSYTSVKKQSYHEDERVDWRRQSMCEAQLVQAFDRLRLCDEDAPAKLVVSLVSVPTEQPVDVMPTLEELYAALDLYEWLEGLAARGQTTAALRQADATTEGFTKPLF
jgi:hypothetical protein